MNMKSQLIKNIILIFLCSALFYSQLLKAGKIDIELTGSTISIVDSINTKKKIIMFGGSELAYNSSTEFYGHDGSKASIESLSEGMAFNFKFDHSKRYFSRPTATKIWIKSTRPLLVPK